MTEKIYNYYQKMEMRESKVVNGNVKNGK